MRVAENGHPYIYLLLTLQFFNTENSFFELSVETISVKDLLCLFVNDTFI
jgi:hypothetical protein